MSGNWRDHGSNGWGPRRDPAAPTNGDIACVVREFVLTAVSLRLRQLRLIQAQFKATAGADALRDLAKALDARRDALPCTCEGEKYCGHHHAKAALWFAADTARAWAAGNRH